MHNQLISQNLCLLPCLPFEMPKIFTYSLLARRFAFDPTYAGNAFPKYHHVSSHQSSTPLVGPPCRFSCQITLCQGSSNRRRPGGDPPFSTQTTRDGRRRRYRGSGRGLITSSDPCPFVFVCGWIHFIDDLPNACATNGNQHAHRAHPAIIAAP